MFPTGPHAQQPHLSKEARDEFEEEFPDITMHHVNARILQPLCERFQKCYAHIVNEEVGTSRFQVMNGFGWVGVMFMASILPYEL